VVRLLRLQARVACYLQGYLYFLRNSVLITTRSCQPVSPSLVTDNTGAVVTDNFGQPVWSVPQNWVLITLAIALDIVNRTYSLRPSTCTGWRSTTWG